MAPDATSPAATEPEQVSPGPFSSFLGFQLISAGDDGAIMQATPGPEHVNGGGIVHGGFLSSLLDSTTGWAVHAALPAGVAAPHVQISVQFIRAALPGTPLVCRGRAATAGRRVASADAEITQDGRLIARAVTSHAVLRD